MRIRQAKAPDVEASAQLWFERMALLQETDARTLLTADAIHAWRRLARQWIVDDSHGFFVAENRGELVGLLVITTKANLPWLSPPRIGEIVSMVLDLHHPQPGLGRALLERAYEWCRAQSLTLLEVDALAHYPVEEAFWRAQGGQQRSYKFWLQL